MEDKKRIFIADDDIIALDSLKKLLEISGYVVQAVSNAKDILTAIKAFNPHIILLDLLMPSIGGLEICQMLNQEPKTQGIPIIVISGLSGFADIEKTYKMGVLNYITKPYDFNKLLQEIKKIIASKEGVGI
ncbi:MAG: response regulator [Candidatus Omnitrophica bacterium]|nr:response regulator [Candidatus Omnitrophota bacterium]